MIIYYAMGGGLGHLTRARAFLDTFGIEKNAVILTSSDFAPDKRIVGNVEVIQVDKNFENDVRAFQNFLKDIFDDSSFETLYIDSFPLGIIGEFSDFVFPENLEINYLARLLKWKNYSHFLTVKTPEYKKTFVLEPLEIEHQTFINAYSREQIEVELKYPKPILNSRDDEIFRSILNEKKPFWLIVHAGRVEEIKELVTYAVEMREIESAEVNLILISPDNLNFQIPNLFQFDLYPANILFNAAERIFTACGFNAMRQTTKFRNKHYFIPFERRFDDQFARANLSN